MSFADQISKDRGQPSTVRIGIVTQVFPLLVNLQGTLLREVGILGSYTPMLGDYVALLGQSAVSADGSSWLALGRATPSDAVSTRLGIIARGLRTTTSTTTTTEVGVLRIDNIPVFGGRMYRVQLATTPIFNSTILNDLMEGRFYYSLTGAATIASTLCGAISIESRSASGQQYTDGVCGYIASPTVSPALMSVLFSVARTAGAGTVSIIASANYPVHMVVEDIGPDPGNTGILI